MSYDEEVRLALAGSELPGKGGRRTTMSYDEDDIKTALGVIQQALEGGLSTEDRFADADETLRSLEGETRIAQALVAELQEAGAPRLEEVESKLNKLTEEVIGLRCAVEQNAVLVTRVNQLERWALELARLAPRVERIEEGDGTG